MLFLASVPVFPASGTHRCPAKVSPPLGYAAADEVIVELLVRFLPRQDTPLEAMGISRRIIPSVVDEGSQKANPVAREDVVEHAWDTGPVGLVTGRNLHAEDFYVFFDDGVCRANPPKQDALRPNVIGVVAVQKATPPVKTGKPEEKNDLSQVW